jgi:mTERF domain-containing protein
VIKPNIAQFRQCGLTSRDIAQMCSYCLWLIGFQPERVKDFLLRAEDLGVSRGSPMFKHMVAAMSRTNKEKNAATLEFLKRSLGCSESEAAFAVSKTPSILGLSDECLLPQDPVLDQRGWTGATVHSAKSFPAHIQLGEAASAPILCHEDPAGKGIDE